MLAVQWKPTQPVSFIVVVFSDEYLHNSLRSDCLNDPFNQRIIINNRANLYYHNLSEALNAGLTQTHHDLIAMIHEDVYLPPQWQRCLESSLHALEQHDPHWGVLGTAGWTQEDELVGHFRDPHGAMNTFGETKFREVARIDEQVIILRRTTALRPDSLLPSIHNIGRDLPLLARARGLRTYVIDAQSIHKYADAQGNLIHKAEDSPKIRQRTTLTYLADKACSDEYFYHKWPAERPQLSPEHAYSLAAFSPQVLEKLDAPIVLLARGGAGSRLLSLLAADAHVFIGNAVNDSGDSLEMVMAVYQGVMEKYACKTAWQQALIVPQLRYAAATMLQTATPATAWGFKLPESMLLVPEIARAFPRARYVHLIRDPLTTCLRRTHMTARLDNHIGRLALPLAYHYCGVDIDAILHDSPALHMAYTTRQQVETVRRYCQSSLKGRYFELRFEEVLQRPIDVLEDLWHWLNTNGIGARLLQSLYGLFGRRQVPALGHTLRQAVDPQRAARPQITYPAPVAAQVAQVLAPLRQELGYEH